MLVALFNAVKVESIPLNSSIFFLDAMPPPKRAIWRAFARRTTRSRVLSSGSSATTRLGRRGPTKSRRYRRCRGAAVHGVPTVSAVADQPYGVAAVADQCAAVAAVLPRRPVGAVAN
jgi:hypothetical protein